ncbi:hypothetical protein [Streptacidiphilus sp. ASG 303]|uniref:hypothetical protein n=1 Tax=Streptomycetaceae TaxID=2062 RepID=UPI001E5F06BF|nr:hypothetical protein [Streptacidiphilus sp. ASG 303]MCD0483236.1 hypothetical protein [Streptacidiphilus sp. ASG 303]
MSTPQQPPSLLGTAPSAAGTADGAPVCSAKGCRAEAVWVLAWNNPKLHTPDRRKTWLACGEHREHLSQFLGVRGFLKDVVPLADWHGEDAAPRP